jgi:hypothetical protein
MSENKKTKRCYICGETKAPSEFFKNRTRKDGLTYRCKICKKADDKVWNAANKEKRAATVKAWYVTNKERIAVKQKDYYDANKERKLAQGRLWHKRNKNHRRSQRLLKNYGITLEDYEVMLENQNHTCKICGTSDAGGIAGRMVVDHCHTTGNVRGLLCNRCNTAIGLFKDDTAVLASAIKYLNESAET